MKKSIMAMGVVLAAMSGVAQAAPGLTGNLTLTNNYIWRGVTQTNDQAAVQGGADYDFGNKLSIGAWVSNVSNGSPVANGTELDLYGSYKIELGKGMNLDVGGVQYKYNSQVDQDFLEAFAKFSVNDLVIAGYYTINKQGTDKDHDLYLMAGYNLDLGKSRSLSFQAGHYDYDDSNFTDYSHLRVAFTKGEFTAAVDKNDIDGLAGRARFTIAWSKAFDL